VVVFQTGHPANYHRARRCSAGRERLSRKHAGHRRRMRRRFGSGVPALEGGRGGDAAWRMRGSRNRWR
jgi:hypothetical protein